MALFVVCADDFALYNEQKKERKEFETESFVINKNRKGIGT